MIRIKRLVYILLCVGMVGQLESLEPENVSVSPTVLQEGTVLCPDYDRSFGVSVNRYGRAIRSIRKHIHDASFKDGHEVLDTLERLYNSTKELEYAVNGTQTLNHEFFEMLLVLAHRIIEESFRKFCTIRMNIRELRKRFSWTREELKTFVCLFRDVKNMFIYLNNTYMTTYLRKQAERDRRGIFKTIDETLAYIDARKKRFSTVKHATVKKKQVRDDENKKKKNIKESNIMKGTGNKKKTRQKTKDLHEDTSYGSQSYESYVSNDPRDYKPF